MGAPRTTINADITAKVADIIKRLRGLGRRFVVRVDPLFLVATGFDEWFVADGGRGDRPSGNFGDLAAEAVMAKDDEAASRRGGVPFAS